MAMVKFLPLAAIIFCKNRRPTVNPNANRFRTVCLAARTAKLRRMNGSQRPFWRDRVKCVHKKDKKGALRPRAQGFTGTMMPKIALLAHTNLKKPADCGAK
jgi:hypothetical protein